MVNRESDTNTMKVILNKHWQKALTLLHSEWQKLQRVLAILSAVGLK